MVEIKALSGVEFQILYESFSKAFSDYDMPSLSIEDLERMLVRRGFNPDLSFGAFENNELVSFTFNGIGNYNGKKTAYDTGTGTIKEFRGKGLARKVFLESIPYLQKAGIEQYLLEVLQHNDKAIPLYTSLGFEVTREFNFFVQDVKELKMDNISIPDAFTCKKLDSILPDKMVELVGFQPSWQNSFDSLERANHDFIVLGVFIQEELIGYGILDPKTGDIAQIAVDRRFRRRGVGSGIIKELQKYNEHHSIKVLNTDVNCFSFVKMMESIGIPLRGKQFEMIKKL